MSKKTNTAEEKYDSYEPGVSVSRDAYNETGGPQLKFTQCEASSGNSRVSSFSSTPASPSETLLNRAASKRFLPAGVHLSSALLQSSSTIRNTRTGLHRRGCRSSKELSSGSIQWVNDFH
ncbi:hypothetical protein TNIN_196781 [Trichonephila inaurata madagascariensis]|uniref:Uncharacterized protein n=1 Tax=Trichonephila inaurata madagascariensis TaxID=2747483 RepID=A0A8X6X2K0_9ARAC|nr:hypothetical protein TNIN_196781 [Trichonephila inaurata madagascariensis]